MLSRQIITLSEHSAIFSFCIKPPPVFKTFVLSIFEWPLKRGFTVDAADIISRQHFHDNKMAG